MFIIYADLYIDIRMRNVITTKLCHVTATLKQQQSLFRNISFLKFYCATYSIKCTKIMTSSYFKGYCDRYNGVTIDSYEESCELTVFNQHLEGSLKQWLKNKKCTIWFRVHLSQASWIPILVSNGFKFHHAKEGYVMLYRWIASEKECNIPPYAHTNLGVGAFVFNEKTNEILVIQERYSSDQPSWKLPGGYVEPGENIEDAVKREVLEETGIETTFKCLLSFRHGHNYAFNCSDIYMIAYLSPINFDIHKCDREIADSQWMKLEEYSRHPGVHENNKLFAKKMLEFLDHKMGISVEYALHPITKQSISVYSISNNDVPQQSSSK